MSFKKKVKELVEAKKKKKVTTKLDSKFFDDVKKQRKYDIWGPEDHETLANFPETPESLKKSKSKKSKPKQDLAHTDISFREKVKALLEGEGEKITLTHPNLDPQGKKSQVIVVKGSDDEAKVRARGFTDGGKEKSKPTNEDSNHPFYQKVKDLSRDKKNNSLLEKKSKTIKLLIGKISPCGKKLSMAEDKKQQSKLVKKGRKKRAKPVSWDEVYEKWVKDKQENPQDYRTSRTSDRPKKDDDEGMYLNITSTPGKRK